MSHERHHDHSSEHIKIEPINFLTVPDDVQVTPNVTGTELNEPDQFAEGTNPISISRLTMDPNTGFERHTHPHNHVLVILEGGGFLIYDRGDGVDIRLDFTAGDVFNVPGTNEHAVSAGDKGITMLSIGSPAMRLIDPERMVFIEKQHRWMIPKIMEQIDKNKDDSTPSR